MLIIKLKNFIYFYIFRFFEFLVFDKISYKWLKFSRKTNLRFYKNEDQLNNFNHNIYAEKFTHPFINLKYLQKLSELNPDLAYQKLPEYDKIKKNWINTNMKYFDSKDYIPEQQVIGSFGNYATLFYYIFYRLNIEKKKINQD